MKNTDIFKNSIIKNLLYFLAETALLFVVYFILQKSVNNEYLLPPIKDTFFAVISLLETKLFYKSFFTTLLRVFKGFIISLIFAVVFSVLAYVYVTVGKIIRPFITVMRSVPTAVFVLILLVWSMHVKLDVPVIITVTALFPVLYGGISSSLLGVDKNLIEMSRAYGVPVKRQIFSLYIPSVAPYIVKESGNGLSFGIKLVVSAEIIANVFVGLGSMIQDSKFTLDVPKMFALTLFSIVFALIFETLGNVLSETVGKRK